MTDCRIYLFTYKRNELLKRALASLINQTFKNWICEVHNDLPEDKFPETYIRLLNDDRFIIKNHPVNLGTTRSFNLAFSGCDEKYVSMLEDDNWWEPTFLEEMIEIMEADESLDISWSNMRIWREGNDQTWHDTGKTIWPAQKNRLFSWPQPIQALGCLHSTGAMLYRGNRAANYRIPENSLSNAVELIRERSFQFPIYLNAKVLANFSQTIVSSQVRGKIMWTGSQVMLLASYINSSNQPQNEFKYLLAFYRKNSPSPIPLFFLANHFYLKHPALLRSLNLSDWYRTVRWYVANIFNLKNITQYLRNQEETWNYLKNTTRKFKSLENEQ